MKSFIAILTGFFLWTHILQAEELLGNTSKTPDPEVKAVPEPKLDAEKGENSKIKTDGSLTGNAPTDIGLIKTEKNCKVKKGKLKCPKNHKSKYHKQ